MNKCELQTYQISTITIDSNSETVSVKSTVQQFKRDLITKSEKVPENDQSLADLAKAEPKNNLIMENKGEIQGDVAKSEGLGIHEAHQIMENVGESVPKLLKSDDNGENQHPNLQPQSDTPKAALSSTQNTSENMSQKIKTYVKNFTIHRNTLNHQNRDIIDPCVLKKLIFYCWWEHSQKHKIKLMLAVPPKQKRIGVRVGGENAKTA
jgi:hypothetical protein